MWETIYQAPRHHDWVGRQDALPNTCFFQMMRQCDLRDGVPLIDVRPTFALLGFACDAGVKRNNGRIGSKEGPSAIRAALGSFPLKRSAIALYDVGTLICDADQLETAQIALGEATAMLIQHGMIPIVVGGGHELAFGHYQGIAKAGSEDALSIVNFDAHFDMRPLLPGNYGSSGTPFLQIANHRIEHHHLFDYTCIGAQSIGNSVSLEETASLHHVKTIYADHIHEHGLQSSQQLLNNVINQCAAIYVSLCLDVFASPFAPGVSAPQILGLLPWQVIALLRMLAQSKKVLTYDIAECCPAFDLDSRTAKLAASLIYEIIHHHAV